MKKIIPFILIVFATHAKAQIVDQEKSPIDSFSTSPKRMAIFLDTMPMTKAIIFLTRCEDCSFISRSGYVSGYEWAPHYYTKKRKPLFQQKFYSKAFVIGWIKRGQFVKHVLY